MAVPAFEGLIDRHQREIMAYIVRSLGDFDLSDQISRLSLPALVIHGRYDPIPVSSSERIARLLGAGIEVFEHSAHMPFVEEHERFLRVSEDFLRIEDQ